MAEETKGAAGAAKVHSVAAVLEERVFKGSIEAQGGTLPFAFAPKRVALASGRIVLEGEMTVGTSTVRDATATLLATQGELGEPPKVRSELLTITAQGPKTGAADAEAAGHTTGGGPPHVDRSVPITEKSGDEGFVGVMYLRLAPVSGSATPAQLNARFAPTSDTERELQWLFSRLVGALHGERADAPLAKAIAEALNRTLAG